MEAAGAVGDVTLRQLQMFLAVAARLHFGKAAEACYVSQSALSQQIMALERALDVRLFERHSRQVRLTPAGAAFVVEARRVLAAVRHAVERARSLDAESHFTELDAR